MNRRPIAGVIGTFTALAGPFLSAGPITVPNASFESPTTGFVSTSLDSWQKTPQPDDYNPGGGSLWVQLTGVFKNTAPTSPDHLDNCDSNQAVYVFADPAVGIFQDYDSLGSNDSTPTHAFNATYEAGSAYILKLGVNGGGGGMQPGVTLQVDLYYRDASSNIVTVATTVITNSLDNFPNHTHLFDYDVRAPVVKPNDAWAGQHIGVRILSTVTTNMQGGYWDLDNVRLQSVRAPVLSAPGWNNEQFHFTVSGDAGPVEILASTNLGAEASGWTSLATITNLGGNILFTDTNSILSRRYYQARQLTP
jgi:hypothetical protein